MIRKEILLNKNQIPVVHSTIGKDSVQWSFSRARRFKNKTMSQCPEFLELPSTLEKRSTTFGFGKRWQPRNPKGNDAPSPDKYSIPSCFDLEKRGPLLCGNQRDYQIQPRSNTPGPGAYDIVTTICKDGPKFSFRSKPNVKTRHSSPPPGTYNPRYNLLEQKKYSEITFGLGNRGSEEKPRPNTPGPGTYDIPSFVKSIGHTNSKLYSQVKANVLKKNL